MLKVKTSALGRSARSAYWAEWTAKASSVSSYAKSACSRRRHPASRGAIAADSSRWRRLTTKVVRTMAYGAAPTASSCRAANCEEPPYTKADMATIAHHGRPAVWPNTPKAKATGT